MSERAASAQTDRRWREPFEESADTEEILTMLADVLLETAIRPFHVNVPGTNFKGERHNDTNCRRSTKHRKGY